MPEYPNAKPDTTFVDVLKARIPSSEWPKEGSVIKATLLKKADRRAYFDLGRFGTGVVWGMELMNAKGILRGLQLGDACLAKIKTLEGDDGHIELSLSEAGRERIWQQAKDLEESGELVKVKISGANSGGLTANLLDLKAFLPVSQLSREHYPRVDNGDHQKIADELKKFIGQELTVKVIDVSQKMGKLIVSERELVSENMKEALKKYNVGDEIQGIVTGIADFGAFVRFVDEPQIEGLVHISELAHRIVDNPKEVLKVDETVKAKIIDIKDGRVSLSLKALQENPWQSASDKFKKGEEVSGKVYKLSPFGAIVDIGKNLQGAVHVSEFDNPDAMKQELLPGTEHRFVIDTVRPEEQRITLKRVKK